MPTGKTTRTPQRGFTYLILLFAIAILGISLATTGVIWSTESRLSKERELEFIGQAFVQAIESYYNSTPGEVKSYPQAPDDLVKDTRFLFTKRHLREIYVNPFTNRPDWRYITSASNGITGIEASLRDNQSKKFVFQPHDSCSVTTPTTVNKSTIVNCPSFLPKVGVQIRPPTSSKRLPSAVTSASFRQ
jgi:type II secretory pathway pseudopilin PulG